MRLIVAIGAFLLAFSAEAAFLQKGCGNTRPQASQGVGSTINFAVLERTGGVPGDTWATGLGDFDSRFVRGIDYEDLMSPRLDRGAKYLYLYQTVNNGEYGLPVEHSSIRLLVDPRYLTSWGYFEDAGLAEDVNGDGALEAVSFTKFFGVPSIPKMESPASVGCTNPAVVDIRGGEDAALNPDQVTLMASYVAASWREPHLKKNRRGPLFGFTTNLPWTMDQGLIHPPKRR